MHRPSKSLGYLEKHLLATACSTEVTNAKAVNTQG